MTGVRLREDEIPSQNTILVHLFVRGQSVVKNYPSGQSNHRDAVGTSTPGGKDLTMTLFGDLYSDQTFACFNSSSRFEERFKSGSGQCPLGTLKRGGPLRTSFELSAWEKGLRKHANG